MEAIKMLACQFVNTYKEDYLFQLITTDPCDCEKIIQMMNDSLQQKTTKTLLTAEHIYIISSILLQEDDEKILEFHFELSMYVLFLLLKQMQKQLRHLDELYEKKAE
ncbi:hypothetical protein MK805_04545 [Shimazuella sp. AN120528]|uniref:hypothetical protein n=1 Tax=Shimazuella soli TaxID=1892854 RepID=UPI001F0FD41A|nr:hypothetical protein [Shimazuella soli]MCH5584236.1 hypothetical protein [Shimazuella soli]